MEIQSNKIPKSLKEPHQWVPWRAVKQENEKTTKILMNCHTGRNGSSTNPSTWGSLNDALKACKRYNCNGIGFVFTKNDSFVGIDLDHCRNPETGKIDQWAKDAIDLFKSYTEISPSGTGLHIFVKGKKPGSKCKNGDVEMYEKDRFFTVTGNSIEGYPVTVENQQEGIDLFYNKYLADNKKVAAPGKPANPQVPIKYNPNLFEELKNGENAHYPSPSNADLTFCNLLVRKYGSDPNIIDKHFRESKRYRAKWDEKHSGDGRTYGQMTIDKAITGYNRQPEVQAQTYIKEFIKKTDDKLTLEEILKDKAFIEYLAIIEGKDYAKYESILIKIQSQGLKIKEITIIRGIIKKESKKLKKHTESTAIEETVISCLPDAPVPVTLLVPGGYIMASDGIFLNKGKAPDRLIATVPVLICGIYVCINTGKRYCESMWTNNNSWQSETVAREVLLDQKRIVDLISIGFPVSSVTARPLVGFLQLFEALNIQHFQQYRLTDQQGWQNDNSFLLGRRYITDTGEVIKISEKTDPMNINDNVIHFKANDEGDNQFAHGFDIKGKKKDWYKAIELISSYSVPVFMVLAALSTILIKITGTPSFIIDLSGTTSSGKTTVLKVIASLFGNPNINSNSSIIGSWNATQISIERRLGLLSGLPFILDDTKLAGNPDVLSKIIYETCAGQGRGRGSIKGTARTASWQTVMITSGESKIVDIAKTSDGGIHGRVLSITKRPFGKKTNKKAKKVAEITSIVTNSYGGAGVTFAKELIKNKDKWSEYKGIYEKLIEIYSSEVKSHGIEDRYAAYFALITLTGKLANEYLGFDWDYQGHILRIYKNIVHEMRQTSNISKKALKSVLDLIVAKPDDLWKPGKSDQKQPLYGWLGAYDKKGNIGLIPNVLKSHLEKYGYEPQAILKEWKHKKWIKIVKERGFTQKFKVEKNRPRCIVIKKKIFDKYK